MHVVLSEVWAKVEGIGSGEGWTVSGSPLLTQCQSFEAERLLTPRFHADGRVPGAPSASAAASTTICVWQEYTY